MDEVHAQLVMFDLDGTLLDSRRPTLPSAIGAALRGLADRGVQLAFASSRPLASVGLFAHHVAVQAHLIGFNGALAVTAGGRELAAETFVMDSRLAGELCSFAIDDGMVNVYRPSHWTAVGPAVAIDHEEQATGLKADSYLPVERLIDLSGSAVFKVMCRGPASACRQLVTTAGEFPGLGTVMAGPDCCDIQAAGVDKGRALRALCAHLDIPASGAIAFGDSDSDAPMLQAAGYGVAVGAASARARAAADETIDGPGTEALAEWVDRITPR